MRFWGIASGTAFGSLALGNAFTLKSHFDFVRSLNNPAGFAGAIDRLQKQSGIQLPRSLVIQRKYAIEEGLHGDMEQNQGLCSILRQPLHLNRFCLDAASPEPEPLQQPMTPIQQGRSPSKWDQIRASNNAASPSSTWDTLRQKHEKPQTQKSQNDSPRRNENALDGQTLDQAQFDALLEKERDLGSQNPRE
jgi:hypothetical protein